jgi:hypothetical protein
MTDPHAIQIGQIRAGLRANLLAMAPLATLLLATAAWLGACGPAEPAGAQGAAVADTATADALDGGAEADAVALGTACTQDQACADQQQQAGACYAWQCVAGSCRLAEVASGQACAGSNPCVEFTCDGKGNCQAGAGKICAGATCRAGVCDPATGECALTAVAAGIPCSDGNPCTQQDACDGAGNCSSGAMLPCLGSACAPQACSVATGACVATPAQSGGSCEDGNPCTLADSCDGKGNCSAGPLLDCGGGPCWTGACQPKTGACAAIPKAATVLCDDGVACTTGDSCDGGGCKGGPWTCACQLDGDCNDANPCTADECVAGSCVQAPVEATPCSDGSACTAGDACAGGQCVPGAAANCQDGNACTADSCDAASGICAFAPLSELACSDGDACTLADSCSAGSCAAGPAKICLASGICQEASCAPLTGACVAVDLAGPCTGSDACVQGQTCQGGQCGGGVAVDCDDGNPCTTDGCQPASGLCSAQPLPDGSPCGSYRACLAGVCSCVLGEYGLPAEVTESFRSVQPAAQGFVAAGQATPPGTSKGLIALISWANQPIWQHRHAGPAGAPVEFAAVAGLASGYQLAGTLPGKEAIRLRLDALGNIAGQDLVFAGAEAQGMVGLGDGAVVVSTAAWGKGASVQLVRLPASGPALWKAALPPDDPQDAARAHSAVVAGAEVWISGHDVRFDAPAQSTPWVARVGVADGKLLSKHSLKGTAEGELVFAMALQGNQLWLAGQVQGADAGPSALLRWLEPLAASGGQPSSTAVELGMNKSSLLGLASGTAATVAVGWRTQQSLDALVVGLQAGKVAWTYAPSQPGQQSLAAAVALADGTLVAVGSRTAGGVTQGYWLRMAADGKVFCE